MNTESQVTSVRQGPMFPLHRLMDITVDHLIIEVDDAIEIAQQIDA